MVYTKLPSEFKKKWIAALRSGDYKQGHKMLKSKDDKYCCLGVACEIIGIKIKDSEGYHAYPIDIIETYPEVKNKLPIILLEQPKERSEKNQGIVDILARMNDGKEGTSRLEVVKSRKSFLEIADWIEENL